VTTDPYRRDREAHVAGPAAAAQRQLDAVADFLGRFVAWPSPHAQVATALWVAHTYLIDEFDSTPRMAFLSPEPGSGKTRALEVIGSMVRRPMHAVNCSPAALFRSVADLEHRPTILFDEIDTVFGPRARDNEELRGFLNAGHRRSGVAYRCVGLGTAQRVQEFPAYAAVALAGLYDVPDTIASRSIVVRMRRRAPDEVVEPYRLRYHEPQGLALGEQLADTLTRVRLVEDPDMPTGVVDRPADVWEPLLSIAYGVGGAWQLRAAQACAHFALAPVDVAASLSLTLLADLRAVFTTAGMPDALPTSAILDGLHAVEESPWRDLRGKALDPAGLARRLRGFQVSSVNVRVGATVAKGYRAVDLHDVWRRYLPAPETVRQPVTTPPVPSRQA
jgi:Protein of unknown function (DUF3631)